MAAEKRKAITDERPKKKAKAATQEKDSKQSKSGKSNDALQNDRKPIRRSVLLQEEKSFPRGGASVLTPIEQKQIRAKAERDVLFEQQTGQKASYSADDDGDLFDRNDSTEAAPAKRRPQVKSSKSSSAQKPESQGIKVHGLSYKTLIPGSTVLGRVTAVTSKDLAVALPNNLTGFVPITAVSEKLNERIEQVLNGDPTNDDEEDVDSDIELKKLFYSGQWLRAIVTTTSSEQKDGQSRRHIELSLDPQLVNGSLDPASVVVNSMLQASVRSVEDHGVIMDLGLANPKVKGFISKKELGSAHKLEDIEVGQALLCLVTGKGSDGKVLKLSPDAARFSALMPGKQIPVISEAPTVDGFLPGTAVDALITDSGEGGLTAKLMGMVDVTADVVHCGAGHAPSGSISQKYKIGSKTKARIMWVLPTDDGSRQVGVSLLSQTLAMPPPPSKLPPNVTEKLRAQSAALEQSLPSSSIIDGATVTGSMADRGLFFNLVTGEESSPPLRAFAHISQLSDSHTESLSSSTGQYKLDSTHRARVIAFNPVDGLYYVSLKQSVISQPFLRLEDLQVGELVEAKVDRLILGRGTQGVTGVIVKLGDHISALVPEMHMSDAALQHPERKFREGFPVKGRVLSVDFDKRQARVTLKKTLVNDDSNPIWKAYSGLEVEQESKGTIVSLLEKGAVVQFYGPVRAFLPISDMSESYVESPAKHFRLGQTVTARILEVKPESGEMKVSCKAMQGMDEETEKAYESVETGQVLSATITSILADQVELELEGGVRGLLRVGHLIDGSASKAESAIRRLRVGQRLNDLVALDKLKRSHQVLLTNKSSIAKDAKEGRLVKTFKDAVPGRKVHGFVRNITPEGVYVEFVNQTVALLPKSQLLPESVEQPAFGLRKDQTITAWVLSVNEGRAQFALTMREPVAQPKTATGAVASSASSSVQPMQNPVDPSLSTTADLTLNRTTKAKIVSVKNTQINVRLADGVHGRVDASEAFDSWEEIEEPKAPLQGRFKPNQIIDVQVLGIRDARGWRFLPFSHRGRGNAVVELSAKRSRVDKDSVKLLGGLNEVKKGEKHVGFINNIAEDCVWVSLSPGVRGRVALMDLSEDVGLLQNVGKNFPIGSALQLRVKDVFLDTSRLDLTTRSIDVEEAPVKLDTLMPGEVVPGRVTKVSDRAITVQLSDSLAGPVPLVELSDDFDSADPARYAKNDIVRVRVLALDRPNRKVFLSLRPSLVLSSSLPVKDPQISSFTHVKPGMLVRGFVKHVGEKGVLVSLSGTVDAFVRISDLSDDFIKDWQNYLQVDRLVQGRVISVDEAAKQAQLSLKASQVDENYKAPIKLEELTPGMIVSGKARKIEDFGVFIDIDGTQPKLSGLAHRSEIADKRVADVRRLYSEGDKVKAKILKVDVQARKISLGLKASYFEHEDGDEEGDEDAGELEADVEDEDDEDGVAITGVDIAGDEGLINAGVDRDDIEDMDSEDAAPNFDDLDDDGAEDKDDIPSKAGPGLKATGFDWTGDSLDLVGNGAPSDSEPETTSKKRKRARAEIKVDLTGDLDKHGPRSESDFERQLLGQPNESGLWIQYMAFQLQLSEMQKARDIAERALRTIHIRDVDEKANIWIAWMNLEVEYGDDDRLQAVFRQACQVQEPLEMHEKLASIYIDSGRHDKADEMFERIVGNKAFRASPDIWLNYATFLMNSLKQPARARPLLPRALQSIPQSEHRLLTAKFAALEFRTQSGDPERGRTIFEGLVSEWPKWATGWDMWVDIERGRVEKEESEGARMEALGRARTLYERMGRTAMKKRRAKFLFKRWLELEEKYGDANGQERVKALAREFVERLQARGGDEMEG